MSVHCDWVTRPQSGLSAASISMLWHVKLCKPTCLWDTLCNIKQQTDYVFSQSCGFLQLGRGVCTIHWWLSYDLCLLLSALLLSGSVSISGHHRGRWWRRRQLLVSIDGKGKHVIKPVLWKQCWQQPKHVYPYWTWKEIPHSLWFLNKMIICCDYLSSSLYFGLTGSSMKIHSTN